MIDESRQRLVRKGLRCRLFLDFISLPVYGLLMDRCIRPKTTAVRKIPKQFKKVSGPPKKELRRRKILQSCIKGSGVRRILH